MRTGWILGLALCTGCVGQELPAEDPIDQTVEQPPELAAPKGTPLPFAGTAVREPVLKARWLGVQGFLLEVDGESVLTAPLFTRPSQLTVTAGLPVRADPALVDSMLSYSELQSVRAIISGHAHYDHLLDVPTVLQRAPAAKLFANVSARNLLAAWAPDRAQGCAGTTAEVPAIGRNRVIALDDVTASKVDWSNCLTQKPAGVPVEGEWVKAGENVRLLAVCSAHPAQVGPYHFGEGDVLTEQCTAPKNMGDWKEGVTLAFLIDFLDPKTSAPRFRIYYQDAPATAPVGLVPQAFLAEKRVDLALLNVGSYQSVTGEPAGSLQALNPRFAVGGHWEDFFRSSTEPVQPITFLNPTDWRMKAVAALAPGAERWRINAKEAQERAVIPQPGDTFELR